jgi:hypothetical protein
MQANGQPCDGDCGGLLPAWQNVWQPYVSAVFLGRVTGVHKQLVPIIVNGESNLKYLRSSSQRPVWRNHLWHRIPLRRARAT